MTIGPRIRQLRHELGMSQAELAAELCRLSGRETVTRETVSRWESGRRDPRPYSLRNLAAALRVDIEDLVSVKRRDFVSATVSLPLMATTPRSATQHEVTAVEEVTKSIRQLDNRFGGGHAYTLASQYFDRHVIAMLNQSSVSSTVNKRLQRAAAKLAHLSAWTAYDIARHANADAHFEDAYSLSRIAGDVAFSGEVLAAKSHHAIHLRQAHKAVKLAQASQEIAAQAAIPALMCEANILEANAFAILGQSTGCASALSRAEMAFDRATPSNTPEWLTYIDPGYVAARFAHCFRDLCDWRQARYFATKASSMSADLQRTHTFNLLILATTYVETDPEQAFLLGADVLTQTRSLQSDRANGYIMDLNHRMISKHPTHPKTVELSEMLGVAA